MPLPANWSSQITLTDPDTLTSIVIPVSSGTFPPPQYQPETLTTAQSPSRSTYGTPIFYAPPITITPKRLWTVTDAFVTAEQLSILIPFVEKRTQLDGTPSTFTFVDDCWARLFTNHGITTATSYTTTVRLLVPDGQLVTGTYADKENGSNVFTVAFGVWEV